MFCVLRDSRKAKMTYLEAETERMLGGKAQEISRRNKGYCVACSVDLEGNCVDTDHDGSQ